MPLQWFCPFSAIISAASCDSSHAAQHQSWRLACSSCRRVCLEHGEEQRHEHEQQAGPGPGNLHMQSIGQTACKLTISQLETARSQLDDARDAAGYPDSAETDACSKELDTLSEVDITDRHQRADPDTIVQRQKRPLPLLPTDRVDCAQQLELVSFGDVMQSVPCSSDLIQQ